MAEQHPFGRRKARRPRIPDGQLELGKADNVITLPAAPRAGRTALRGAKYDPSTSKMRKDTETPLIDLPANVKADRKVILNNIENANAEIQQAARGTFAARDGMALRYGIWAMQMLVRESVGDPLTDIRLFTEARKPNPLKPDTEDERAVKIMMCEGLGIIEEGLIHAQTRGDTRGAAVNALRGLGGNLHIQTYPRGGIDLFEDILVYSKELLETFRYKDDDAIKAIQEFRYGLAEAAGFDDPYLISSPEHIIRTEAYNTLRRPHAPAPTNPAA